MHGGMHACPRGASGWVGGWVGGGPPCRYGADGSSECTSKPSLATQWWWGSVKDQVAAVIKRDMPEGWILYEDTSAYDLQLSLKPLPGEP